MISRLAYRLKYIFIGAGLILLPSALVYVSYTWLLNKQQPAPSVVEQRMVHEKPEEAKTPQGNPPAVTPQQPETIRTVPPVSSLTPSQTPRAVNAYTVYIGSYTTEAPAAEEVSRWKDAGFAAAIIHANNHFRVSLGSYPTIKDAREFAKKWQEAFEYGYWIGKVE